jgi:hypothetical protein
MSKFTTAVKRGIRAAKNAMGPQKYQIGGKVIVCPHCGGSRFTTMYSSLIGCVLTCANCTRKQIFDAKPEPVEAEST